MLFYSGSASAELAYLCFVFLRLWFPGPGGWGVRLFGEARQYIMPVIGSRNTHITEPLKRPAAYNLHYVNIALGIYFWQVFLYPEAVAQLLPVLFLPLKIQPYKNKSRHVLQQGRTKSMTGKRAGRDGSGEALHLCRKLRNLLHR